MRIDEESFPGSTAEQRARGQGLIDNAASDFMEVVYFGEHIAEKIADNLYGADLASSLQQHFETAHPGGMAALLAGCRGVQFSKANHDLVVLRAKYNAVARELKERRNSAPAPRDGVHGSYRTWPVRIYHPAEGETVIQHLNDPKKVEIVDRGYVETLSAKRRRTSHERPA